jgi:hypothetical protein
MPEPIEGTYRVVNQSTGRPKGRTYKTLSAAESMAHHLSVTRGVLFVVARVVRTQANADPNT